MNAEVKQCEAVHIDDGLRVSYRCKMIKGHDGPHIDMGTQKGTDPHTGVHLLSAWELRWTDMSPILKRVHP